MNIQKTFTLIAIIALLFSCNSKKENTVFIVKNSLNLQRSFETVSLTKEFLKKETIDSIGIKDVVTGKIITTQLVDNEGDGIMDEILFQPEIAPNSEKEFEVIQLKEIPITEAICYSRFVPERTDDYTWENNKVAFRIFGPTAQKMKENGTPGGTLSSGVDAWLKKVDYPIINKWYHKELETNGSYHEDNGEGLDNFHVGVSRGVGGIAIKKDTTYYFSKNFTKWRTITTGPIRTSFYVEYADWDAAGNTIKESRIISLDYGNYFSKFNSTIKGSNEISAGLTLHEKDGIVNSNTKEGWTSYWQPHGNSEIGTAIIVPENHILSFEKYDTPITDLSNAYATIKVINNQATYYSGFGWKERKEFNSQQEWENYVRDFSKKINSPITTKWE
ncbi:uncharacterized protein DUF4861 [Maribacter vaceletii]|uniref:Uncharacterized protein DUF4861 n=1 Tax=Maribacter vaceletii TaxID=1206816 RepID=A0A495EBP7_9FLAO|nr:DUF4861 family protein [Maribacter vaceletii]RKR14305.1 uncharacterized protein DUF4861 [Maribacter vaceletii]